MSTTKKKQVIWQIDGSKPRQSIETSYKYPTGPSITVWLQSQTFTAQNSETREEREVQGWMVLYEDHEQCRTGEVGFVPFSEKGEQKDQSACWKKAEAEALSRGDGRLAVVIRDAAKAWKKNSQEAQP